MELAHPSIDYPLLLQTPLRGYYGLFEQNQKAKRANSRLRIGRIHEIPILIGAGMGSGYDR
jgi:hypothetical protein